MDITKMVEIAVFYNKLLGLDLKSKDDEMLSDYYLDCVADFHSRVDICKMAVAMDNYERTKVKAMVATW